MKDLNTYPTNFDPTKSSQLFDFFSCCSYLFFISLTGLFVNAVFYHFTPYLILSLTGIIVSLLGGILLNSFYSFEIKKIVETSIKHTMEEQTQS